MSEAKIYSITGLFDSPEEVSNAVKEIREYGYKKFDVNSSYPLHGIDEIMGLKPSKIGYITFLMGLLGGTTGLGLMWWMAGIDYPLLIGGKPSFSLPAHIPITFELVILSAAVLTVLSLLVIFLGLPATSNPLNDTNYLKKVSVDKFGISIEANDYLFDQKKTVDILEKSGAKDIEIIYYPEKEMSLKQSIFAPKFLIFLILVGFLTSGLSYFTLNKLVYLPPFDWMVNQNKLEPQREDKFFEGKFSMLQPVEGTVARGHMPYLYKDKIELADKNLKNPLTITETTLAKGKIKFDISCSPCHGYNARGESRLRGQFPPGPNLLLKRIRNYSDGKIFHIITQGQGIMPPYNTMLSPDERWAIIIYIRSLQQSYQKELQKTAGLKNE